MKLLRLPAVLEKTTLSRSSLLVMVKKGEFPNPTPLSEGGRSTAWLESEVDAWIAERVASSRFEV